MSEHTKEPWVLNYDEALEDGDLGRVIFSAHWQNDNGDLNAQRIVACVNACRDIPTEWLEANEIGPHVSMCGLNQLQAEQQRDELLDALNLALEYWEHRQQRYKNRHPVWVKNARAIIAEVEADK